ncbi:SRPBCC family protein [Agromyces binzhouensis]|uniref:SRPBCC family protein n=1 Tax=Agromyces binzhouensis TaxID=1817495 RepID=UPI003645DB2D
MSSRSIYVETTIRADLDVVWDATQDPARHARWDIRFSEIRTTGVAAGGAARFEYTRRTPFHTVHGTGVNLGEVSRPDGARTSALRFWTPDRFSPIRSGRGYWRYEPVPGGIRFITGYDYEPGWGPFDVLVRPVIGWATAWSFDRLRIWLEQSAPPERWPLASVVWLWRPDRPRASRCRRAPEGQRRRADHLRTAPATLAALPDPETLR